MICFVAGPGKPMSPAIRANQREPISRQSGLSVSSPRTMTFGTIVPGVKSPLNAIFKRSQARGSRQAYARKNGLVAPLCLGPREILGLCGSLVSRAADRALPADMGPRGAFFRRAFFASARAYAAMVSGMAWLYMNCPWRRQAISRAWVRILRW